MPDISRRDFAFQTFLTFASVQCVCSAQRNRDIPISPVLIYQAYRTDCMIVLLLLADEICAYSRRRESNETAD